MKKLLTIAAIAAASTALAVESSNTFGILRVDSTSAQTIVSVPWEGAGATGDSANKILVKDVVKTANLTKGSDANGTGGDQLYCYSGTTYKMWALNDAGVWVGASSQIKKGNETISVSAGTDQDTLNRGDALILVRSSSSQPFYLYGQYTDGEKTTTCVLGGLTLLASPLTIDTDLNKCTWANIGADDEIYVPTATITVTLKRYVNASGVTVWGTKTASGVKTVKAIIPAGQGVWYKSNSTEGTAPTVTWVQIEPAQN